jgi:hypothetical protein
VGLARSDPPKNQTNKPRSLRYRKKVFPIDKNGSTNFTLEIDWYNF